MSGVCRYLAGIPNNVRGMRVPCRYSDNLGYAGNPWISWSVPGVCRYPAGIPNNVWGYAASGLMSLWYNVSSVYICLVTDFLLASVRPMDKVALRVGLIYLPSGSDIQRTGCNTEGSPNSELFNHGKPSEASRLMRRYSLIYCFTVAIELLNSASEVS